MSQQTCLSVIYEILNDPRLRTPEVKSKAIVDHFYTKIVITKYGRHSAYKVANVDFNKSPATHYFTT